MTLQGLRWSVVAAGAAVSLAVTNLHAESSAEAVRVFRTMMPDAGPSAFAVGLPDEIGFCYDPGRGGINYLWRGAFVDLAPTWRAKINEPAVVRGQVAYRETKRWPLRLNGSAVEPRYEFRGYLLLPDGVEFHYLLDGILVREEIRAADAGRAIVRRFRLSEPCSSWRFAVEAQSRSRVSAAEAVWDERREALIGGEARDFTIRIQFSSGTP